MLTFVEEEEEQSVEERYFEAVEERHGREVGRVVDGCPSPSPFSSSSWFADRTRLLSLGEE